MLFPWNWGHCLKQLHSLSPSLFSGYWYRVFPKTQRSIVEPFIRQILKTKKISVLAFVSPYEMSNLFSLSYKRLQDFYITPCSIALCIVTHYRLHLECCGKTTMAYDSFRNKRQRLLIHAPQHPPRAISLHALNCFIFTRSLTQSQSFEKAEV